MTIHHRGILQRSARTRHHGSMARIVLNQNACTTYTSIRYPTARAYAFRGNGTLPLFFWLQMGAVAELKKDEEETSALGDPVHFRH